MIFELMLDIYENELKLGALVNIKIDRTFISLTWPVQIVHTDNSNIS